MYCHWCKKPLTKETRTKDHIYPKWQRNGMSSRTVDACFKCNNERGDMDYDEFKKRRMQVRPLGIQKVNGEYLIPKKNKI